MADKKKGESKFGQEYTSKGDNARFLRLARVALSLPAIDMRDIQQIQERTDMYFDFCEENDYKPGVESWANWLGITRRTLERWRNGDFRAETHSEYIEKIYNLLLQIEVDYLRNGKENPVAGIFLLKNTHGFRDSREVVVTPNNPLGDGINTKQIEDKYAESVIDTTGTEVTEE